MEKEKNGSQRIAAIILAVLIIICGVGIVFLKAANKVPALALAAGAETEKSETAAEEAGGGLDSEPVTVQIDDFEILRNGAAAKEEMPAEEADAAEESDDEYICSYSSERRMTEDDIEELRSKTYEGFPEGKDVIQMAVNEMYARYGYQFNNQDIQAYFDTKQWYQDISEKNPDMNSIYENMTDVERANVDLLSDYRGE